MDIYVYIFFYFHIFSFLAFKHDFIRCVDFTRIAAVNTATHNVTVIGHTYNIWNGLITFLCSFCIESDEKSRHTGVF